MIMIKQLVRKWYDEYLMENEKTYGSGRRQIILYFPSKKSLKAEGELLNSRGWPVTREELKITGKRTEKESQEKIKRPSTARGMRPHDS